MKAKMYKSKSVEPYVKRLNKKGYIVKFEFDLDGIHYYSVVIRNKYFGNVVGEYSTPRQACKALADKF